MKAQNPDGTACREESSQGQQELGIWCSAISAIALNKIRVAVLVFALLLVNLPLVLYPLLFQEGLWIFSRIVFFVSAGIAFYTGCSLEVMGASARPSKSDLIRFTIKALILLVLLKLVDAWFFSAKGNTLFGGFLRLEEFWPESSVGKLLWVLAADLTEYLWMLMVLVLFGTALPAALLQRRLPLRQTVKRGCLASGYIISRVLIGPVPVFLVGLGLTVTAAIWIKLFGAQFDLQLAREIGHLSLLALLSFASQIFKLLSLLMLGIVLSKAYRYGETRLSKPDRQSQETAVVDAA
ncbi:hypothetical protein HED22_16800 [Thalassospira sp. HF15]|uniref:hypothetical protein n=1 Tax=Thalassospira sp. HF15 TaxID=2722755 RepID=UPI001431820A|nr:hypothetical protein [Thalassospira sp. HF15]NIY77314.1 hypothetical protein [Thalassospira sp. HF15]